MTKDESNCCKFLGNPKLCVIWIETNHCNINNTAMVYLLIFSTLLNLNVNLVKKTQRLLKNQWLFSISRDWHHCNAPQSGSLNAHPLFFCNFLIDIKHHISNSSQLVSTIVSNTCPFKIHHRFKIFQNHMQPINIL